MLVTVGNAAGADRAVASGATLEMQATCNDAGSDYGIAGKAIIRPIRPHATVGEPNLKPYQAMIDVLDSNGRLVNSFQSGPEGNFRVGLPPGKYTIRLKSPGLYPRASEQTVVVQPKT